MTASFPPSQTLTIIHPLTPSPSSSLSHPRPHPPSFLYPTLCRTLIPLTLIYFASCCPWREESEGEGKGDGQSEGEGEGDSDCDSEGSDEDAILKIFKFLEITNSIKFLAILTLLIIVKSREKQTLEINSPVSNVN